MAAVYENSGTIALVNTSGNSLKIRKSQVITNATPIVYSPVEESIGSLDEEGETDVAKILEHLGIYQNKILAVNPEIKGKLEELICEYRHIWNGKAKNRANRPDGVPGLNKREPLQ